MSSETQVLEGYMINAQGYLVPIAQVKEIDLTRNDLVMEIVIKAMVLKKALSTFKGSAMGDIQAFIELSAERYNATLGGKKGNVTLASFDGRYKIQRAISDYLVFDERLQVAKQLIDECIHEWTKGSRSEIHALIDHAFQVDKEGKVNTGRILGLKRLDIKDEKWKQAMQAITDSIQVTSSKTYLRIYEREGDSDQFKAISLDIAGL